MGKTGGKYDNRLAFPASLDYFIGMNLWKPLEPLDTTEL
jgi:hypothetical protein